MNKIRQQDQDAMMSRDASANKEECRRARQRLTSTLRGVAARSAIAWAVAVFVAAGITLPVLADPAPREALPSSEAIGWLLETEPTGSAAPWISSRSGYSGTVTVTRGWDQADGTPCRQYTIAAVAGGSPTVLKGTGCRVGPGEWNLREDAPVAITLARPSPPAEKPAATATDPAIAAVLPTSTPAALPPTPLAPINDDDDATGAVDPAPAHPPADTAQHKPLAIAASLPSRSDE